ncbi:uncharacterized protein LOC108744276 isoform X2 [Agrilus planipennis]|uniref:Uncharacterized protein LOC108744276 isoform X2 n=1 Tax=Agrilus planipennis TaxID=224129 RepID=A0A1W4XHL3_AGRPL|nr:uncharacterized protein LOC108744276 isoform X2 [Agrilus planipennis]
MDNTNHSLPVEVKTRKSKNGIVQHSRPLSNAKSSDWTEASLEVPDEVVHLKNPQLSLIFNDDSTPTPPPRKHKKTLREKLETAAKNGLQALQTKKMVPVSKEAPKEEESPKPVEEPPFIKKTVIYGCPLDDHDHAHHNRDHKHSQKKDIDKVGSLRFSKDAKRKKNLSVVSLPNINEFRFSLKKDDSENNLVDENPEQKPKKTASTGKLESYMHRCRSIGSIFPQKNKHHKHQKTSNDADSDDSFGGLEDWDCKILEHYKPKDASLQRPRRPLSDDAGLSDVEKLIVSHEEYEKENPAPARPLRRSESLVKKEENAAVVSEEPVVKRKKENDDAQRPLLEKKVEEIETIVEKIASTSKEEIVKRTLLQRRSDENKTTSTVVKKLTFQETVDSKPDDDSTTKTPPPTPVVCDNKRESLISISKLTTKDDEGNIEHSSLIKLLHEYSKNEAQQKKLAETVKETSDTLEENMQKKEQKKDLEKNPVSNSDNKISNAVEEFLNAERKNDNSKSALDIFVESKCQVVS